ncbi:MAG TPA: EpsD family peptidyl-prolyl cis-trans isomerase [Steroidobacteraceae bacterium]|nr:EpsD family peptidyl-prolyl cis-trans isomerase [Steroidobacteraceae bacterium]
MARSAYCLAAVVASLLTACAGGKSGQTSQVVAKVDDSEITVSQLSEALAARGGQPVSPEVTREAVDSLIDEQLLVKAALDNKLDRDPAVVQALEHMRRQVLARAYLERLVFPRDTISAAEQIEYYKQHPALFEKRKVFQVMVYTVNAPEIPAAVRTELSSAHTVDDVAKVLTAHNLPYESQSLTRAAEQLPLADLPKFEVAKVGDVVALQGSMGRVPLMLITAIQDAPISVDRAQPIIQQYLVNTRNARAVQDHLKQARATAKIAYFDNVTAAATEQIAGQLQSAVATQAGEPRKTPVSLN